MTENKTPIWAKTAILLLVLFLFVVSCGVFFNPQYDRNNPNDPFNPVQPMENFHAVAVSESEIRLTLSSPADQQGQPSGFIIVRSNQGPPTQREDGIEIYRGDLTLLDISDTTDIEPNSDYWYSVWSYGEGDLAEHYTFSGTNQAKTELFTQFANFQAVGIDNAEIQISFTKGNDLPFPAKFVLIRKTGTVTPVNDTDGDVVEEFSDYDSADGSFITVDNDSGLGLMSDTEFAYGLFAYDMDNSLYTDLPQATDTADTVLHFYTTTATDDGYARDDDIYFFGQVEMLINNIGPPYTKSLINFSFIDRAKIGRIDFAEVVLSCTDISNPGFVDFYLLLVPWSEASPPPVWSIISGDPDSYYITGLPSYGYSGAYVDLLGYFSWEVSAYVEAWVFGGYDVNGFLIGAESGANPNVAFETKDAVGGTDPPTLSVNYYGDP